MKRYLLIAIVLILAQTSITLTGSQFRCGLFAQAVSGKRGNQRTSNINPSKNREVARMPYDMGMDLRKEGDESGAAVQFQVATSLDPSWAEAFYALGESRFKIGQLAAAKVALKQAVHLDPEMADAYVMLGFIALEGAMGGSSAETPAQEERRKTRALAEADQLAREALTRVTGSAKAHFLLGLVYHFKEMMPQAIAEFQEAVKLQPEYHEAHYELGTSYYLAERYTEAESELKRALEIDPSDILIARQLCLTHIELKEFAAARADAEKLRSQKTADGVSGSEIAESLVQDITKAERIEGLAAAVKARPKDVGARLALGKQYLDDGRSDLARDTFAGAVELDPDSAEAHMYFGFSLVNMIRFKEANEQVVILKRLNPEYATRLEEKIQRGPNIPPPPPVVMPK